MGVRLPTILGKAIDDVWKTVNQEYDEDRIVDLVNCIGRMEHLMGDLQGNSKLRPIIDDGAGDIALWNKVGLLILQIGPTVANSTILLRKSPNFSEAKIS